MTAIQTRFLPTTHVKGSRIKAFCRRGSITISAPDHVKWGVDSHRYAVEKLVEKFNKEDVLRHNLPGKMDLAVLRLKESKQGWNAPFLSGELKNGDYAHVFMI